MKRNLFVLIGGLLLGAVGTAYFLSAPRGRAMPGVPVGPPANNGGDTSGTVTVTVDEKFFDSVLGTIFRQLGPPQLQLSQKQPQPQPSPAASQNSCGDVLVLNPEGDNVKTGVRFTGGKITAPLAFTGSYTILTQCVQFKGTAKATVDLSFDQQKQTVFGQLNVDDLVLDGVPPIVSSLVSAFVRKTISEQLKAFEVLQVSQLALSLNVHASGGSVKARVKDVRAEIQEGAVKLYLTYDFSAERNAG